MRTDEPNYPRRHRIAPGGDVVEMVTRIASAPYRGYLAFIAFGIRSITPDFDYAEFLIARGGSG